MTHRRWASARRLLATLVGLALLGPATARAVTEDETLLYRWRLDGFLGSVAAIFVPGGGEGELTLRHLPGGRVRSELTITAPERSDFFRYGAEWEPASGTTVRAWSSQLWRGEPKSKQAEVGQTGVIDIATAVHALRRDPVLVYPRGPERRRIGSETIATHHYAVRAVEVPGRRLWKGELDLWLADDPFATPVEILVSRSSARVRLELVERRVGPAATAARGGTP
jgi:hypothetical protein